MTEKQHENARVSEKPGDEAPGLAGDEASKASLPWLVLGLGNPGLEYRETRHNLGFMVVEELARRDNVELISGPCSTFFASTASFDLAQPQVYMNRSGLSLRCLVERSAYPVDQVLVVYDDVSLPLGTLRLRGRGGPGGHRGMESVIENLRTSDVARLRLGIAPEEGARDEGSGGFRGGGRDSGTDLAEFVLQPFEEDEWTAVAALVQKAADASQSWRSEGVQVAMNRWNG